MGAQRDQLEIQRVQGHIQLGNGDMASAASAYQRHA